MYLLKYMALDTWKSVKSVNWHYLYVNFSKLMKSEKLSLCLEFNINTICSNYVLWFYCESVIDIYKQETKI